MVVPATSTKTPKSCKLNTDGRSNTGKKEKENNVPEAGATPPPNEKRDAGTNSGPPANTVSAPGQYRNWGKQAAHRSETSTVELTRFMRAMGELKTISYSSPDERKRGLKIVLGLEQEKPMWGRRERFPEGKYFVEAGQEPWTTCLLRMKASLMLEGTTATNTIKEYYSAVRDASALLQDNEYIVDRATVEWKLRLKWIPE